MDRCGRARKFVTSGAGRCFEVKFLARCRSISKAPISGLSLDRRLREHRLVPIDIDVYAVKRSNPIPTIVLCERKHWNKAVDQNVIYSFRSVCADAGAHYGVVISKKGFQSAAVESREHTSIHLLT
jgi:hypothetical protein